MITKPLVIRMHATTAMVCGLDRYVHGLCTCNIAVRDGAGSCTLLGSKPRFDVSLSRLSETFDDSRRCRWGT